ncbi:hypothetical protein F4779DRAFT_238169 [Xylariaceae sp. FL0662B]|nr:hypothetical protein F4779DRAFT_238169 [Xylariaceae sp. FL0662B]
MQIAALFVSLLAASVVSAKDDNSTGTSVKSQCRTIAKMQNLVDLAANQTKLENKADGNTTKIDEVKSKAADASTQLTSMTANATLMGECAVIQAHQDSVQACGDIQKIEKMMAIAANDTKLNNKLDNNATKIDEFKAKASDMAAKLTDLQSNGTLTTFCAAQRDVENCESMKGLQKLIAKASNQTALDAKFEGNTTKAEKFKAKAAEAQTKLDALMSNSTLMATCSSLSQTQTQQGSTNNTSDSSNNSPAIRFQPAGQMAITGLVVAIGALFMI